MEVYKYRPVKPPELSEENFLNAINCARACIESILDNEQLAVEVVAGVITIRPTDSEGSIGMTPNQCRAKIKSCFCDSAGNIYPEFVRIVCE